MKDEEDGNIAESALGGKRRRLHRAYMLRCWCEATPGGEPLWRFALEDVLQPHGRQGFSTLQALIEFLKSELGDGGSANA